MRVLNLKLLLFTGQACLLHADAFVTDPKPSLSVSFLHSFAVPVSELEQNLTSAERDVTGVVRRCSPSVAFVSSFLEDHRQETNNNKNAPSRDPKMPPGTALGAGSGFCIDRDGYIVTNYHVIESAYGIQRAQEQYEDTVNHFVGNATKFFGSIGDALRRLFPVPNMSQNVYVRIDKSTEYQPCRIVNVQPDLDVAVLKIINSTADVPPVSFGSSSSLIVGQSLVAIGNPFGLDQTVTSGVVSALNRELQVTNGRNNVVRDGNVIRNCIQTDCAINPGNSGGPLLNLAGEVIGVNTAIVTTSGSNAGIGFAIPSDEVEPVVRNMIRQDRLHEKKLGWLGVSIVKSNTSDKLKGNWVTCIQPNSPASGAGIRPIQLSEDGRLESGDCIVAIGGNNLNDYNDLRAELEKRVKGEELAVTLQDTQGERRVVYLKLGTMPQ
jgi:S1-C subfamily serine protease